MIRKKYTIYHLHSQYSNGTTNIDSVTKPIDYIKRASEWGMDAIAFSEHGNIFNWVEKKLLCEQYGLKYIHGVEMYVTKSLYNIERDNYHCGLYAKNYDGVLELNELLSHKVAYKREDRHFYYSPRITLEELMDTSDNIIITTACIGGILARERGEVGAKFLDFLRRNKHRCFLEIQHHLDNTQIEYNKYILELSKATGIRIIAGTDTHALDYKHSIGRSILQKAKKVTFDGESNWDMTMKTYDELVELYMKQGIFNIREVEEALENTNVLSDMVEEFELDYSFKYPNLFEDPETVLREKIIDGVIRLGLNNYKNYISEYQPRIEYELDVYRKQGALNYLLLDEDIKTYAKANKIYHGPSRGSVSGSLVAYIIGLTEIDPIIEKLNFERFMNDERVTLADIDTDWPPQARAIIKDYIFESKRDLYCAEVITFNTVAIKGSIRDIGRALNMDLSIINEICKNIEDKEDYYREMYKELFEYVDIIKGCIVSVGINPSGLVVSPIDLSKTIGTLTLSTSTHPVVMLSKKYVEMLNYVKLDILGLENIDTVNKVCEMAGIERLTPGNVPDDENVWKEIRNNPTNIFQWESNSARKYLEKLFSDETIEKIRRQVPNFRFIDLFSIGNGAIRPAGASYRDQLANGIVKDNGHYALNEFLSPTLGYLVYQEQIIEFLHKFCGFTMGQADIVRRAFAKKEGTDKYIPEIKAGFCKTMFEVYNVEEEESLIIIESFLQVIIDASDYLFSLNHSTPYSYIGYILGYLRYYYPLEFFAVTLNQANKDQVKTLELTEYLEGLNIKIEQPIFGKSKFEYFVDKENNTIYKGLNSVKFLNENVSDRLYEMSIIKEYDNFVDLYVDCGFVTSKQWEILIKIGYFKKFGTVKQLLYILDLFTDRFSKKTYKKENLSENQIKIIRMFAEKETEKQFSKVNIPELIKYIQKSFPIIEFEFKDLARFQLEYTGSISITDPSADPRDCVIISADTKYTPTFKLYRACNGEVIEVRVRKDFYLEKPIKEGNMIYVYNCVKKNRRKLVDGKWKILDDFYLNIEYFIK